jgi:hypothetical protein
MAGHPLFSCNYFPRPTEPQVCLTCTLQVSTPGLQAAHHYIWGLTQDLQAAAQARGDVIVQTAFENYTGSTDFDFVVGRWVGGGWVGGWVGWWVGQALMGVWGLSGTVH